jgi:hypothetical protein
MHVSKHPMWRGEKSGEELNTPYVYTELEMAIGTRNPSTRRVLPDKDAGMGWIFYPWVRYWAKSYTRRVWRVRVYTTHTRIPTGKTYPQK